MDKTPKGGLVFVPRRLFIVVGIIIGIAVSLFLFIGDTYGKKPKLGEEIFSNSQTVKLPKF